MLFKRSEPLPLLIKSGQFQPNASSEAAAYPPPLSLLSLGLCRYLTKIKPNLAGGGGGVNTGRTELKPWLLALAKRARTHTPFPLFSGEGINAARLNVYATHEGAAVEGGGYLAQGLLRRPPVTLTPAVRI